MSVMRIAIALGFLMHFGTLCFAQSMPPQVRAVIGPGDATVVLVTTSGEDAAAKLHAGKAKTLHQGSSAGSLAAGHGIVVVALAVDDKEAPFRVYALGKKLGAAAKIARPGKRQDFPNAVAATATPDGFAVFFQEIEYEDPTAAHTYLLLLGKDGKPGGKAVEIGVPWGLGAAVWNGAGYHLALFYPGGGDGMRLSMVSLTAAGQPEQHPDWASAAGFIADVHLVNDEGKIRAFYRGGGGGDRLLESDVTKIRGWGSEPPKARDHGALAPEKAIVITAQGIPEKVDRP